MKLVLLIVFCQIIAYHFVDGENRVINNLLLRRLKQIYSEKQSSIAQSTLLLTYPYRTSETTPTGTTRQTPRARTRRPVNVTSLDNMEPPKPAFRSRLNFTTTTRTTPSRILFTTITRSPIVTLRPIEAESYVLTNSTETVDEYSTVIDIGLKATMKSFDVQNTSGQSTRMPERTTTTRRRFPFRLNTTQTTVSTTPATITTDTTTTTTTTTSTTTRGRRISTLNTTLTTQTTTMMTSTTPILNYDNELSSSDEYSVSVSAQINTTMATTTTTTTTPQNTRITTTTATTTTSNTDEDYTIFDEYSDTFSVTPNTITTSRTKHSSTSQSVLASKNATTARFNFTRTNLTTTNYEEESSLSYEYSDGLTTDSFVNTTTFTDYIEDVEGITESEGLEIDDYSIMNDVVNSTFEIESFNDTYSETQEIDLEIEHISTTTVKTTPSDRSTLIPHVRVLNATTVKPIKSDNTTSRPYGYRTRLSVVNTTATTTTTTLSTTSDIESDNGTYYNTEMIEQMKTTTSTPSTRYTFVSRDRTTNSTTVISVKPINTTRKQADYRSRLTIATPINTTTTTVISDTESDNHRFSDTELIDIEIEPLTSSTSSTRYTFVPRSETTNNTTITSSKPSDYRSRLPIVLFSNATTTSSKTKSTQFERYTTNSTTTTTTSQFISESKIEQKKVTEWLPTSRNGTSASTVYYNINSANTTRQAIQATSLDQNTTTSTRTPTLPFYDYEVETYETPYAKLNTTLKPFENTTIEVYLTTKPTQTSTTLNRTTFRFVVFDSTSTKPNFNFTNTNTATNAYDPRFNKTLKYNFNENNTSTRSTPQTQYTQVDATSMFPIKNETIVGTGNIDGSIQADHKSVPYEFTSESNKSQTQFATARNTAGSPKDSIRTVSVTRSTYVTQQRNTTVSMINYTEPKLLDSHLNDTFDSEENLKSNVSSTNTEDTDKYYSLLSLSTEAKEIILLVTVVVTGILVASFITLIIWLCFCTPALRKKLKKRSATRVKQTLDESSTSVLSQVVYEKFDNNKRRTTEQEAITQRPKIVDEATSPIRQLQELFEKQKSSSSSSRPVSKHRSKTSSLIVTDAIESGKSTIDLSQTIKQENEDMKETQRRISQILTATDETQTYQISMISTATSPIMQLIESRKASAHPTRLREDKFTCMSPEAFKDFTQASDQLKNEPSSSSSLLGKVNEAYVDDFYDEESIKNIGITRPFMISNSSDYNSPELSGIEFPLYKNPPGVARYKEKSEIFELKEILKPLQAEERINRKTTTTTMTSQFSRLSRQEMEEEYLVYERKIKSVKSKPPAIQQSFNKSPSRISTNTMTAQNSFRKSDRRNFIEVNKARVQELSYAKNVLNKLNKKEAGNGNIKLGNVSMDYEQTWEI